MDTSYDVTDYTNLRCVDNYTYDSGWKSTSGNFTYGGTQIIFYPTVTENDKIIDQNIYYWFWEGQEIATTYNTLSVTNGGYTYHFGSRYSSFGYKWYTIKRTQPRTEYKAFSSF
ncbi:hypothetical protein [Aliarcobacter butzleri]|uniref:hypothetical protein n=2 Tax=Aliarcobacter butzleri TaxID=28197 RepID=UPI002B24576E|nr:hypothetical protein [Aliarcobacter butzleri]